MPSKRVCKEAEVDCVCSELKKKQHSKKYSEPQYQLWARMIVNGIHAGKDELPQVPMIVGAPAAARTAKKSFEDTISSTVAAFGKAVMQQSSPETPQQSSNSIGISPGKAVDIRGKCYAQLASLKKLFEEAVIDEKEIEEQKGCILGTLRKLS